MSFRNLDYIRQKDPKLYEALSDLDRHGGTIEQQINGNRTGQPLPPPSIDGLSVTGQNGHFHAQITHKGEIYRGVQYYLEYANNPGFAEPHAVHLGDSREHTMFLGNGTYYWRAGASYSSSPTSGWAYHGGAASPLPVSGGGAVGGPALLPPQGSGTGKPGEGLSGPGPIPFRSASGSAPVRGDSGPSGGAGSSGGSLLPSPATGLPAGMTAAAPGSGGIVAGSAILFDTYANWTAANYDPAQLPLNTQFVITDHNFVVYVVRVVTGANKWVYEAGTYAVVQSAIAGLKGYNGGALGTNDTGLLISVTDYAHVLRWGGAAWTWGPGESGSGYFSDFAVAPTGSGWHACDGTVGVTYLKADGTTGTVTLPNTAGTAAFRKLAAAYAAAITAAVMPTISGHTETGNAVIPAVLTGSGFAQITGSTGNDALAGQVVQSGAGVTVAAHPHTHPTAGTVTDTGHQHTVTAADTGHQHNLTSANAPIALPADPVASFTAIQYFRQ